LIVNIMLITDSACWLFCFALNFLQELRELQELQKLLYTFLHVMASNDLSHVFLAPNCRQHLDAVMQLLLFTSCSHKDMQLRKVYIK
jgi:exportin-T